MAAAGSVGMGVFMVYGGVASYIMIMFPRAPAGRAGPPRVMVEMSSFC